MKKIHSYFLGLLVTVLFAGCEQVIEIELPAHEPQLVLNCTFMPDSAFRTTIFLSKHLQDTANFQWVQNASLQIYEDGLFYDSMPFTNVQGQLMYSSNLKPRAGHAYTVVASLPGHDTVRGTDIVPVPVALGTPTYRDSVYSIDGAYYDEISVTINDPAGQSNYYLLGLEVSDSIEVSPGIWQVFSYVVSAQIDDPVVEQDYFFDQFSITDNTFDGQARTIRINVNHDDILYGDVKVVLLSVSETYIRHLRSLAAYERTVWDPFAEPVIIYSNMTPEMGIFAGYSRSDVLVPR